jgi:hypothetical protein
MGRTVVLLLMMMFSTLTRTVHLLYGHPLLYHRIQLRHLWYLGEWFFIPRWYKSASCVTYFRVTDVSTLRSRFRFSAVNRWPSLGDEFSWYDQSQCWVQWLRNGRLRKLILWSTFRSLELCLIVTTTTRANNSVWKRGTDMLLVVFMFRPLEFWSVECISPKCTSWILQATRLRFVVLCFKKRSGCFRK